MVSNLILSYSERFFVVPVSGFGFCTLGSVARALTYDCTHALVFSIILEKYNTDEAFFKAT